MGDASIDHPENGTVLDTDAEPADDVDPVEYTASDPDTTVDPASLKA